MSHDERVSAEPLCGPASTTSARLPPRSSPSCTPLSLETWTRHGRLAGGASETSGPKSLTMASSSSGQNQGSATSSQCDDPPPSEGVSTTPGGPELETEEVGVSNAVRVRLESCLGPCLCPCPCPFGLVRARESGSGLDPPSYRCEIWPGAASALGLGLAAAR